MPQQTESSTTLNPGTGGGVVRDLLVTTDAGAAVKQQVMAVGDPLIAGTLLRIGSAGEAATRDDEIRALLGAVVGELRLIRLALWDMNDESNESTELAQ